MTGLPPATGIGLKPEHYSIVLAANESAAAASSMLGSCPVEAPAWVEVHPQNYFCDGGPAHRWLAAIAEQYRLSFHSVGLSIGSAGGCNADELERLAALCDRYQPASVSDHLSWSGHQGDRLPDLLPLPYTNDSLAHFVTEIGRIQDRLDRMILIENPSRYIGWAGDALGEAEFLTELCRRSGCGLLFDINNVEVSATNLDFDPYAIVDAIDPTLVGEIHLAGHAVERHGEDRLLIDDHGSPVSDLTWLLYERFIARAGAKPTLIEWDTDVPAYPVLMAEAAKAEAILARHRSARQAA